MFQIKTTQNSSYICVQRFPEGEAMRWTAPYPAAPYRDRQCKLLYFSFSFLFECLSLPKFVDESVCYSSSPACLWRHQCRRKTCMRSTPSPASPPLLPHFPSFLPSFLPSYLPPSAPGHIPREPSFPRCVSLSVCIAW